MEDVYEALVLVYYPDAVTGGLRRTADALRAVLERTRSDVTTTVLQQAESDFRPLPFDADAARAFGRVAASLRASGRKVQARSYDAMIAATAIANELPLYTVNPADFAGIEGLELRLVTHPDQVSRGH